MPKNKDVFTRRYVIYNGCPEPFKSRVIDIYLYENKDTIPIDTRIVIHDNAYNLIQTRKGSRIPGLHFVFTNNATEFVCLLDSVKARDIVVRNYSKAERDFFDAFNRKELRQ
jgi:hypothetical protein